MFTMAKKQLKSETTKLFGEKIQIWDKLLKISHRFRLQNTIGND